ncbi:SDR family oxidoreductase [Phenylobacterium aquaticum]|uniref:SDR family oxidoreductase n=1 Tax=Phenylobacterium aquaticum TaxID=1763816 RepID=UPI0026EBDE0E|nr:SDR family oxidoreductase [Phenylobacterium aquaticum]
MTKTMLITGASSGIGLASAKRFLQAGWNVVATARRPEVLEELARSDRALVTRLDVTDQASIAEAVALAIGRFGAIDVLINNAGVGLAGPIEAVTPEQFQRHFQTNLFGLVETTRAVLPLMRARREGLIINVGSIAGRFGLPFLSPYNASKFAVEGLTESLHYELKPFGVRVKLIEPGGTRSEFAHEWAMSPAYEPQQSVVKAKMTAGGAASPGPETVAAVILGAARDRSDRLRYAAANGGAFLMLNRLLPTASWRRAITKSFLGTSSPRSQAA